MNICEKLTRRSFVALATGGLAAADAARAAAPKIPIGLELYSVRNELKKDTMGTLDGVAKMGYQVVEFFAPITSGRRNTPKKSEEAGRHRAQMQFHA